MKTPEQLLTTKEAGEILGVTPSRVRQLVLEGGLPAVKRGRDLMLRLADINKLNDRLRTKRSTKKAKGDQPMDLDDISTAQAHFVREKLAPRGTPPQPPEQKWSITPKRARKILDWLWATDSDWGVHFEPHNWIIVSHAEIAEIHRFAEFRGVDMRAAVALMAVGEHWRGGTPPGVGKGWHLCWSPRGPGLGAVTRAGYFLFMASRFSSGSTMPRSGEHVVIGVYNSYADFLHGAEATDTMEFSDMDKVWDIVQVIESWEPDK